MKMELWYIGKMQNSYINEGFNIYSKRIRHYVQFELRRIPRIKNSHKLPHSVLKEQEAQLMMSNISRTDFIVLLDENGTQMNSIKFSKTLEQLFSKGYKRIIFLIGGVHGAGENIIQRADLRLSLSRFTFPHEMVRLIFAEQLYRAFTILKNEAYHNP